MIEIKIVFLGREFFGGSVGFFVEKGKGEVGAYLWFFRLGCGSGRRHRCRLILIRDVNLNYDSSCGIFVYFVVFRFLCLCGCFVFVVFAFGVYLCGGRFVVFV